jgi:hypothetical protein
MIYLMSKMENTYVKGVLLKKGENQLTSNEYGQIKESPVFKNYVKRKWVVISNEDENLQEKTKSTSQKKETK